MQLRRTSASTPTLHTFNQPAPQSTASGVDRSDQDMELPTQPTGSSTPSQRKGTADNGDNPHLLRSKTVALTPSTQPILHVKIPVVLPLV